jgi:replicative DNA helicase
VLGHDATLDPDRAVALVQGMLDELARDGEEIGLRPDDLLQAIRERQRARDEGRVASWGLRSLDALFEGGMFGGDVIVLAAQTSFGKSSLAIQAAAHNAEAGHVLYATYEMTPADTGKHTFARISGHSLSDAAAFLDSDSLAGAREAHNALDLTVFRHQPDAARLVHEVRTLHARKPLRLIVVDYIQKVPPPAGVRYGSRSEAVGEVSRQLKGLALHCDAPTIAVAQLNRAASAPDRVPVLADLRESGAIEQDSDGVLFIHKENREASVAEMILAKNRMGPLGKRQLRWLAQQAVFADF